MASIRPMRIPGRWPQGYVLDFHTVCSEFVGYNEFGYQQFDTKRTDLGELVFRLKNRSDTSVIDEIAETAATFIQQWKPGVDAIVPVPASRTRALQPVVELCHALELRLSHPCHEDWLRRVKEVPELKNVHDFDERLRLLDGIYEVDRASVRGTRILLIDDLYRSGATMNAAASALYDMGGAQEVFALAITCTRSKM